ALRRLRSGILLRRKSARAARSSASIPQPTSRRRRILLPGARPTDDSLLFPAARSRNDVTVEEPPMLMFNNLIDGEWLSDGARAPNVNPSDTKDLVGNVSPAHGRQAG